ncbi:hypothetical protein ACFQI7_03405 [Paenibacillus allorhizosphaerae]|uniref:Heparin-sulfate lyase N-terminal domain-containing protein n=1 Tax=Paenibacillus allorhizosphaerae TaxID=2849866 RepID=A0ABM8VCV2_9BACL|nr:hypothetical protein [Paenibacillus allorhizosphaerae]CAG7625226.1 hypothetical protein PAECIP111802_01147 [Paenibacillus allorhizosphaerae]
MALDEWGIRTELKPTMEVRRFLGKALEELQDSRTSGAESALLRLKLLTEAWSTDLALEQGKPVGSFPTAHSGGSIRQTLRSCFFSQGFYFQLLNQLKRSGAVDAELNKAAASLAQDVLTPAERDANNRSFFFAIAQALASRLFPNLPEAGTWNLYAEAVWSDWYDPGDCYEPGYVAHNIKQVIELGLILGKEAELRSDKAVAAFRRYREHISPSGLAVQPGDGGSQTAYVDALALMAEITGDGTFLWAAQQAFLAGGYGGYYNAEGGRLPAAESEQACRRKFEKLRALGIEPAMPPLAGGIQHMYPRTYRIADRLIMNASMEKGKPYAAFYLNDRAETLHHAHEDNRGDLYHYEVDGVMYLYRSGWHKWAGQANTFVVEDAAAEFPFCYSSGLQRNRWYKASSNMRMLRDYMGSERYEQLYASPESFRHTGAPVRGDASMKPLPHFFKDRQSPYGVFLSNPEGMAGKNEVLTIQDVTISVNTFIRGGEHRFPSSIPWYREYREAAPADGPVELLLTRIHVGGPKGLHHLINLETFPEGIEVVFYEDGKKGTPEERRTLSPEEISGLISIVHDERTGTKALKVVCPPGRIDLTWTRLDHTVHLTEEYQRIGFDYLYLSDVRAFLRTPIRIMVNGMTCRSLYTDHQQGGILRESVSQTQGQDSFGSMRYEGVYTHDSHWMRQTLLTEEGYLLVVDRFMPGPEADGMAGGPVWQLPRLDEQGLFWFDMTADAKRDRKLMVYFHPQRGRQYGVQFQPKLWQDKAYAVYDKALFEAGREETFVSVIVPHDADVSGVAVSGKSHFHSRLVGPGEESKGIVTGVRPDGTVTVRLVSSAEWNVVPIAMELQKDGGWRVIRES